MSESTYDNPQTFISYSWSSSDHEEWVLNLATELEESGVHVILDKWDLREGADKFAFMEKMVTDPNVRKVIVVCDRMYAKKADDRKGGVGTETQIMSKEVYEQVDPAVRDQKFVALITEKDGNGNPYVPTFLNSRIYIDMSEEALRAESFERLLRWIYGKPLHKRPERGKPPAYLFMEDKLNLGTGARFHRAIEAVRQNKEFTLGALQDYFDTFADQLDAFSIEPEGEALDDQVVESIEAFLPYRDELVDLFLAIARYRTDSEPYEAMHAFFERIFPYALWSAGAGNWRDVNADNFKFILRELFLYAAAALLKNDRFEKVNELVERGYYFPSDSPDMRRVGLAPFSVFNSIVESLDYRNQRLGLNALSLEADLIRERANRTDLKFEEIMQADLVLYIRDELGAESDDFPYARWWPDTLMYTKHRDKPFEIFARAQSTAYFDRVKVALGIDGRDEIIQLLKDFDNETPTAPNWRFATPLLPKLMNVEKLATWP